MIPESLSRVLDLIVWERERQDAKWGPQNHPDGTDVFNEGTANWYRKDCEKATARGQLTWRHILQEEVAEALCEELPDKLRDELVQVAAVCVAWIEALDRRAK